MPSEVTPRLMRDSARLHPVSVLIGVPLLQLVRALVIPAFAVIAGGGDGDRTTLLLLLVVVIGLTVRVLAWQRFRWSFDGRTVRVEQGVLSRSRRVVGVDRVQQVELDRPFVQRLLGVATLRIDTAGSDAGPEIELRVLPLADALALRSALQPAHGETTGAAPGTGERSDGSDGDLRPDEILRLPLRRVALASVTGVQLLLAPALLLGLLQLAGERVDELIGAVADWLLELQAGAPAPGLRTWLAGAAALIVASVVTTLVVAVVRDGGFVVLRVGDDLVLRRGLLGTRESTVPLRRVQVVRVTANPLRRLLGVASLRIHSAGGSSGGGEGGTGAGRRAVIPLIGSDDVERLLAELLPDFTTLPELRPHPPAARRRALWRRLRGLGGWFVPSALGWAVLAGAPPGIDLPVPEAVARLLARDGSAWSVPLTVGLVLVVAQVLFARAEHRALAHGADGDIVVARNGTLARTLSVAPLARLQGVTRLRSLFQERRGLATVRAHVAGPGGDVVVLDADVGDAEALRWVLEGAATGTWPGSGSATGTGTGTGAQGRAAADPAR
jgi:putative membrane protein